MVRPHTRRRPGSANFNRHTCRAMRAMYVPCKQPASPTTAKKKMAEDGIEGVLYVQQLRTEKQTGNIASAQNGYARTNLSRQFK
jgi:hypothetical protein